MQLFPLGAGTTAGKPAQLLCILVTAADYCFVYNSSTASAGAGLRCSEWYPRDGYTARGEAAAQQAPGTETCAQRWGLLFSPGSSR